MQVNAERLDRTFPWVKELWLLDLWQVESPEKHDLLVVSNVPPKDISQGQRKRLLAELESQTQVRFEIHLTTAEQLKIWLASGARFSSRFHRNAVKVFQRP